MSWANYTGSDGRGGSDELSYRLKVFGVPQEAVSTAAQNRAANATLNHPERFQGLALRGAKVGYRAELMTGRLIGDALTVGFVDEENHTQRNRWTRVFNRAPTNTTWLTADVAVGDATINVATTSGFASFGVIWIDGEAIYYSGTTGTTFTGCNKGWYGTRDDSHRTSDGALLSSPQITDWPALFEGRRAQLFAYGSGDDPQGDGTLVWQGVVNGEPTFNGVQWTLSIDSIVSVLKQQIGADLPTLIPRGIYYPGAGPGISGHGITGQYLWVQFEQLTTDHYDASRAGIWFCNPISGFFETNADLCAAVNTAIQNAMTATPGFTGTLQAVDDGPTGWHLEYHTPSGSPLYTTVGVWGEGGIDGPMGVLPPGDRAGGHPGNRVEVPPTGSGIFRIQPVIFVGPSLTYYYYLGQGAIAGAGAVPRGWLTQEGSMYVDTATSIPASITGSSAEITWPETAAGSEMIIAYLVTVADAANRRLTMQYTGNVSYDYSGFAGRDPRNVYFTPAYLPMIRWGLDLNSYSTGVAGGGGVPGNTLYTFLTQIQTLGPGDAGLGLLPVVLASDWDGTTSGTWAALNFQPPLVSARNYHSWMAKSLEDVVRNELLLAGYILSVNSSGALAIRPLRLPAPSEVYGAAQIGSSDILNDSDLLNWQKAGSALANTAVLQTGYLPSQDRYDGIKFTVRDVSAFGQSTAMREIQVAPLSAYVGPTIQANDVVRSLSRILGVLARPYSTMTVQVSARKWSVQIGDAVAITYSQMPADDGTVGTTQHVGLVIGWQWDLLDPRVTLTVLTTTQKIGGYAPAAQVTAQTNTSGNTWQLTLSTAVHPSGTHASTFWAVGDRVMINRFDGAASRLAGIVTIVATDLLTVTFDGVWTPGTDSWYVTNADSTDATGLTAREKVFVDVAGSDSRVQYAPGPTFAPAFLFGP